MLKDNVLFLCTGNSARSQMAEGLLRKMAGDRFNVFSAGTEPTVLSPFAAKAMQEIGIDISGQKAKSIKEYLGKMIARYVIVVCERADRECPTIWLGGGDRLFWPFEDPARFEGNDDEKLQKFRDVRDQVAGNIKGWLKTL